MDGTIWLFSLLSVFAVSAVSLIGIFTLWLNEKILRKLLLFFVSFATGSLFGGAFFHLIPESVEVSGIRFTSFCIIAGLLIFFILEKFIHWRHCHIPTSKNHQHPVGIMNLVGDGFHNLIDGLVIGASYIASIPLGIATTIAVLLHEVPQEIGDFSILVHAGFSKKNALLFNFASALTSVIGVVVALIVGSRTAGFAEFLVPFTAGGFIYIAGSDLIPELHKECSSSKSFLQFFALVAGIAIMLLFTMLE